MTRRTPSLGERDTWGSSRTLILLVVLAIALAGLATAPAEAAEPAPKIIVYGDSFSSGEGLADTEPGDQGCQRALGRDQRSTAWGVKVARHWGADPVWFAACTGAETKHWSTAEQEVDGKRRDKTQRAEALDGARLKGAKPMFDAETLSFGGNDIKFAQKIYDCLGLDIAGGASGVASGVGGWLAGTALGVFGRCSQETDIQMRAEIDVLGKSMGAFYNQVAADLAPGGTLVVAGYPQVLATVADWPPLARSLRRCNGIHIDDAYLLNGINARLNEALSDAVDQAQKDDPKHTYVWVDVNRAEFTSDHSLCGTGEDFLNGLTVGVDGPGVARFERSFHPNQAGHDAYAESVAKVDRLATKPTFPDWKNYAFPKGLCGSDSGPMTMKAGKTSKATSDNPTTEAPGGSLGSVVEGDLTGDGVPEAVVSISCNRSGVSGGGALSASIWKATGSAAATPVVTDVSEAVGAAGGQDSGFIFDTKVAGGILTVVAGASGPGDLSGQPQSRQVVRFRLEGTRLKLQGTVKVAPGPDKDPVGPFMVGSSTGWMSATSPHPKQSGPGRRSTSKEVSSWRRTALLTVTLRSCARSR